MLLQLLVELDMYRIFFEHLMLAGDTHDQSETFQYLLSLESDLGDYLSAKEQVSALLFADTNGK